MTLAVTGISHAPSYGHVNPGGGVFEEIEAALAEVRAFVKDYDPEVVIAFGPDHFNGILYDMLPQFAIGAQAIGIGDYGTPEGPLPVDSEYARALHKAILDQGIDIARSERLEVDHGITQPLEFIFGHDLTQPFVPVYVNAIGFPLGPMSRVRLLGEAAAKAVSQLGKRALLVASGGISHNPPVPKFDGGPAPVQARLIDYNPTPEERTQRENSIVESIRSNVDGRRPATSMNVEWDEMLMATFRGGDLTVVDGWDNQKFVDDGGSAAHEMRSWIAAYSALAAAGTYHHVVDKYWAVEGWDAGFGVTAAITDLR